MKNDMSVKGEPLGRRTSSMRRVKEERDRGKHE
jgi:hypothetical protein